VSTADGKGQIRKLYSYDEQGRIRHEIDIDATSGRQVELLFNYDPDGTAHVRKTDADGRITELPDTAHP
jgi:hypothetical protein